MASIENRSRTQVSVKNHITLTKFFPFDKEDEAKQYVAGLRVAGHKPMVTLLDEAYLVRFYVNGKRKSHTATTEAEAIAIKKRIEAEQYSGLFVDYTKAHQTSLADLLIRYLQDEAPRNKGFLVAGYQINSWLHDAGLPRQDIAAIHAAHPNPQNRSLHIPRPTGKRMSQPCEAATFIRKSFASLEPEHFHEYIDERLQSAEPATVDRELDVFRAVCTAAINQWRIHVHTDPMAGVKRPRYFNERDRRLRGDEENRIMASAHAEDQLWSARALGDELFAQMDSDTKYQRLQALKMARETVLTGSHHVPLFSTFIQFQLMTGARRSETLQLKWSQLQLDEQTAFLPETKNGRARTLPVRSDLVALLKELPRASEYVFPIPMDYLRKAWKRICEAAGIATEGDERLRIHDLRHEAISRVAEAGSRTPGGFSLLDLQAFSGHRDPRMLMRYAHLTPTGLAKRLDAAFAEDANVTTHHGRRRLTKKAALSMSELMLTPLMSEPGANKVVKLDAYRRTAA
ncbi:site-specific integrase [Variovorax sp. N23]|uniref:site-specific integrase n=1 Tax=Variovorax sp. N23 TaxID=2980555 RepID=UPI0021CA9693|nr:site-specific integrase [Variovorax sp. N23]MCU4119748.1 site-specific integrase [Variovorax sp. N23]